MRDQPSIFHERTWKDVASGKPDLSLTSLSQSSWQLLQAFSDQKLSLGGLDAAAGELGQGHPGVQQVVGQAGEYSCGRLEAGGKQSGAWSGQVQRKGERPTFDCEAG